MKESYKYLNPIYSIQVMLMEKKELRKKLFFNLNFEIISKEMGPHKLFIYCSKGGQL